LGQEILVGFSKYPTEKITKNSYDYRPLGLGYANLGALLMAEGLPYDSDEGRAYAGAVTSLMAGRAYAMSSRTAEHLGPFAGYAKNAEPMLGVMRKHRKAAYQTAHAGRRPEALRGPEAGVGRGPRPREKHGYRNAQVTVLAPPAPSAS